MTERPSVSVIVASYGRPGLLRRCLLGLHQLNYRPVEVIVVADQSGLDAAETLPFAARLKMHLQECANLSEARNLGISVAAGDYCAFIDDDAVPEPAWLDHLVAAAEASSAKAATGTVIGRNGFSVQWGCVAMSPRAQEWTLEAGTGPSLAGGAFLKLHGTNMLISRATLCSLGGFDAAFRFYLDDSDLACRIRQTGCRAVFCETARVHHAFAESARRTANRIPTSLFEIAASQAVFLRKHAPNALDAGLDQFRKNQKERLERLVARKAITIDRSQGLMSSLEAGFRAGRERPQGVHRIPEAHETNLKRFHAHAPAAVQSFSGRWYAESRMLAKARDFAANGVPVHVISLKPTPHKHQIRFTDSGVWLQRGGLFGASKRCQPMLTYWRLSDRIAAEMALFRLTRAKT